MSATRADWVEACNSEFLAQRVHNFSALEVADVGRRAGDRELQAPTLDLLENAIMLIDVLQYIRDEGVRSPVLINSWYRDEEYNKKIGGVPWSMHLTCGAADIVKVGYTPSQVADMLEAHPLADKLGIGRYNTFTHVDIRGWLGREAPARW
ncbi:MAG TPA: hypothetical protein DIT46_02745 [Gemmatimonadetes bacterium]|nr:hypothetical protein [Gemmatimonadota bacterium]|tara:strand:+ start:6182 stop:6634 length:453 start_codon:yes stop_codon:yes gene_type:complete